MIKSKVFNFIAALWGKFSSFFIDNLPDSCLAVALSMILKTRLPDYPKDVFEGSIICKHSSVNDFSASQIKVESSRKRNSESRAFPKKKKRKKKGKKRHHGRKVACKLEIQRRYAVFLQIKCWFIV